MTFAVVAAAAAALAALLAWLGSWPAAFPPRLSPRAALLLLAHPDDESMFLVPTIAALLRAGYRVSLLCLSEGQRAPSGADRAVELSAAAAVLGVRPADVAVGDFPDGMDQRWDPARVAQALATGVARAGAELVVTFDAGGVTGHPNHIACWAGARAYAAAPGAVPCYGLDTVHPVRKFAGSVADVVLSAALQAGRRAAHISGHPRHVTVAHAQPWLNHAAMGAHASQYVWFRALFLLFSRYTWVNTLTLIMPASP